MNDIFKKISMIFNLAKSDFKKRFVGSYFGIVWMFIQPLATILVYTLIFQVGFKTIPPMTNIPYVIWLIPGIIPWFLFQDALIQGTNVLYEYSFLVKKVVFDVRLLPMVKLMSSLCSHIFYIIIMIIAFIIARINFTMNIFSIVYFTFALLVFTLGIIYITGSVNVFFKDLSQIVGIALQFGIWMVPIMYDENIFANRALIVCKLLKLNPFYYIVKGYRYAMLGGKFDDFAKLTIYFWCITLFLIIFGYRTFSKLRKHFADVL